MSDATQVGSPPAPSSVTVRLGPGTRPLVEWPPVVGAEQYLIERAIGVDAFRVVGLVRAPTLSYQDRYADPLFVPRGWLRYRVRVGAGGTTGDATAPVWFSYLTQAPRPKVLLAVTVYNTGALVIVDPETWTIVSSIEVPGAAGVAIGSRAGKLIAYVCGYEDRGANTVTAVGLDDLLKPRIRAEVMHPVSLDWPAGVSLLPDGSIYVAVQRLAGGGGITRLAWAPQSKDELSITGSISAPSSFLNTPLRLTPVDAFHMMLLPNGVQYVPIIDVVSAPMRIRSMFRPLWMIAEGPLAACVSHGFAYVSLDNGALMAVDIENLDAPRPVGALQDPDLLQPFDLALDSDRDEAFTVGSESGVLCRLDLSVPGRPRIAGRSTAMFKPVGGTHANGVAVQDGVVYVCGPQRLAAMDRRTLTSVEGKPSLELGGTELWDVRPFVVTA